MTKLISFHGDPKIKQRYLDRVRAHYEADEIVRGQYWAKDDDCVYRGSAVGCTIHGNNHYKYETELGMPSEIAFLEDFLFEHLPYGQHKTLPAEFLEAIEPGSDLNLFWPKMSIWLLSDIDWGVLRLVQEKQFKPQHKAVKGVLSLFERIVDGETPTNSEWWAAFDAARDAWGDADAGNAMRAAAVATSVSSAASIFAIRSGLMNAWAANEISFVLNIKEKMMELLKNAPVVTDGKEVTPHD